MKKSLLLLFLLLTVSQVFATIRRVNNNPGVTLVTNLVFANFTNAINAAAIGDTIYMEPSDINYGDLFINKRVIVVGPGYLLNKNPNTPFDKRSAIVSRITFSTNSASSKINGLVVKGINGNLGDISFSSGTGSEISIENCLFSEITGSSAFISNALISNCFIIGSINKSGISMTNSLISNNIIWGAVQTTGNDNIIKNNIIFGGADYTANYVNNIIYQNGTPELSFSSNVKVYNNVCVGCTGTPANNNFFTVATNIFVVAEPRTFDDLEDDNFVLHASSPAKAKGVGGIDCGVFAGLKPYVLSGIPPFPMITAFSQGAPSGGNIPITISIKRN